MVNEIKKKKDEVMVVLELDWDSQGSKKCMTF
jgi:hypothetical protein